MPGRPAPHRHRPTTVAVCIGLATLIISAAVPVAFAQRTVRIVERVEITGTVQALSPGRIRIEDEDGQVRLCRIQKPDERGLALQGAVVNFPARIEVRGTVEPKELRPGMLVQVTVKATSSGRVSGKVERLEWLGRLEPTVEELEPPPRRNKAGRYRLVGAVVSVRRDRITLALPENPHIRRSKLAVPLAKDARVDVRLSDLSRVRAGDRVRDAVLVHFDTGDWAVQSVHIELAQHDAKAAPKKSTSKKSGRPGVAKREDAYGYLSDAPQPPRDVRSSHFVLHTDISDRQARMLLDRLEIMYGLLVGYFGQKPRRPIECYVVRDLRSWQGRLPAAGMAKIAEGAGVTISRRVGSGAQAVVYACDRPGVVQHEAVHAFCSQTFGSTGPTWYAEGIAEVGNYWKEDQESVDVPAIVIHYLRTTQKKSLAEIVAPGQITGDSWQAYAWRWALCHLLMHNPNYAPRFRALGVGLMRGERGVSFQAVYGPVGRELSFEYDWFTRHVDNGFRADLCAWDWKTRFRPLGSKPVHISVRARRGWQATGASVSSEFTYGYAADGKWRLGPKTTVDADGNSQGLGRLEGIILSESWELSEPFDLGREGTFRPPTTGRLYVRCHDDWTQIGNNSGSIRLELWRKSPAKAPR